jgi:hypothetical protein
MGRLLTLSMPRYLRLRGGSYYAELDVLEDDYPAS